MNIQVVFDGIVWVMRCFIVCLFLILVGCTEDKRVRILRAYETDIAKALSVAQGDQITPVSVLSYPQKRDLQLDLIPLSVSFGEFLSLNICGLRTLIAERNGQLGKVMPVSRILFYEHSLLKLSIECRDKVLSEDSLRQKLDEIIAVKRENVARVFWNATFASTEFRGQFSLATSGSENLYPEQLDRALVYFITLGKVFGDHKHVIDMKDIERAYASVETQTYGGYILQFVARYTQTLEHVSEMLENRLQKGSLSNGPEANKIRKAFTMYYMPHIQPEIVQIHRDGYAWLAQINRLAKLQEKIMPNAFKQYYQAHLDLEYESGLWQRFELAIRVHAAVWQKVFNQTGGLPKT